jgi:BirA family transcriptional regulator, biotin operon repressor / biotin---[acetyl-CoA-carboxylase] ligase
MPDTGDLPEGWRLASFAVLDSTNDEALRRINAGESHGFVVVTDLQLAGRGRRNAVWHSDAGNLYMSIIVEIPDETAAGQLAFVSGLAAADAIARTVDRKTDLKWPNDLMLEGKKLGGILIEGSNRSGFYAVGLGINIVSAPSGMDMPAIALSETGATPHRDELLGVVCSCFVERWEQWLSCGFSAIRLDWLAGAHGLGQPLLARLADGTTQRGIFTDVDETGALVVQRDDGTERVLSAGAVFFNEAS